MKYNNGVIPWIMIGTFAVLAFLMQPKTTPSSKSTAISKEVSPPIEVEIDSVERKSTPVVKLFASSVVADDLYSRGLRRVLALQDKALLTEDERMGKEKFFSNPSTLHSVEKTLISTSPDQFTRNGLERRFETLFALEQALEWEENPLQSELLKSIEKIILFPIPEWIQAEGRRAMVGDKMELYAMLFAKAPGQAEALLSKAQGTTLEKILTYASKRLSF
jgi:hypothetical protein